MQGKVFGCPADRSAVAVGPVEIGRVQAGTVDVDAEVGADAAVGERVEDGADRLVRRAAGEVEGHGDVEAVDDDMVEGAGLSPAGRGPSVQVLVKEVGDEH